MRRRVAALARDRTSGASALAGRAARLLRAAASNDRKSLRRWQQELRALGLAVAAAQPAMGSLLHVVDLVFRAAAPAGSATGGAAAVREALAAYLGARPAAMARAGAETARRLPRGACCLTLSASAVVFAALREARRRGRLAEVMVAESRPGGEGRRVAARLAARGIPAVLIADAEVASAVAAVTAVLVGADAVTPREVWNKCGTFGAALAARGAGRPFLVATTADRCVPAALAGRVRARDETISLAAPRGVRVVHRLFDATPLRLVTRVLTEDGGLTPAGVRDRAARTPVSGWW